MEETQFENRKETVYRLICDARYEPMKLKELAVLLEIPRERRQELLEILEALLFSFPSGDAIIRLRRRPIRVLFWPMQRALALYRWRGWIRISLLDRSIPRALFTETLWKSV